MHDVTAAKLWPWHCPLAYLFSTSFCSTQNSSTRR